MERGEEMNSHLVCFRLKVFVSLYQTMTFKGTWKYFRGQPTNLAVNVNVVSVYSVVLWRTADHGVHQLCFVV